MSYPRFNYGKSCSLTSVLADKDELARAEFFWRRRPRLLPATGFLLWIILALGLPFWLFTVPANRGVASNHSDSGSRYRDRTICAVATSV